MDDGVESVRICEGGRLVVPAALRRQLGLNVGDYLFARAVDGELRLTSRRTALERSIAIVAPLLEGTPSAADELIAERRAEAARE